MPIAYVDDIGYSDGCSDIWNCCDGAEVDSVVVSMLNLVNLIGLFVGISVGFSVVIVDGAAVAGTKLVCVIVVLILYVIQLQRNKQLLMIAIETKLTTATKIH